jgi:hypothetical protein
MRQHRPKVCHGCPLQFSFSPVRIFAGRIEYVLDVTVQCFRDADTRERRRSAKLHDQDQRFHSSLPLRGLMLGFWKLRGELAGILQRDEPAAAEQRYRIVEWPFPVALRH